MIRILATLILFWTILAGCATIPVEKPRAEPYSTDCPPVEITIMEGDVNITDADLVQMAISHHRCKELFGPQSCLSKLTRIDSMRYTAICKKGLKK